MPSWLAQQTLVEALTHSAFQREVSLQPAGSPAPAAIELIGVLHEQVRPQELIQEVGLGDFELWLEVRRTLIEPTQLPIESNGNRYGVVTFTDSGSIHDILYVHATQTLLFLGLSAPRSG